MFMLAIVASALIWTAASEGVAGTGSNCAEACAEAPRDDRCCALCRQARNTNEQADRLAQAVNGITGQPDTVSQRQAEGQRATASRFVEMYQECVQDRALADELRSLAPDCASSCQAASAPCCQQCTAARSECGGNGGPPSRDGCHPAVAVFERCQESAARMAAVLADPAQRRRIEILGRSAFLCYARGEVAGAKAAIREERHNAQKYGGVVSLTRLHAEQSRAASADKLVRAEGANLRKMRATPIPCARPNVGALAACFRVKFTDEGECSSGEWREIEAWYDEP